MVARFFRSAFTAAKFAFDFVVPNLGTRIAARTPMMTRTARISTSVKPARLVERCMVVPSGTWRENLKTVPAPRYVSVPDDTNAQLECRLGDYFDSSQFR